MKVAVITRHAVTNYGSLLQAMATQQVIEDLGHSCEIIDYIRKNEHYSCLEKTLVNNKVNWNNNVIKRLLYLSLRQPECIWAGKKFEKAQNKYLKTTKRYTTNEQLKKEKPIADVYVTGSDQVWGPMVDKSYDSAYCLSFTNKEDKKIAYAASFGHTEMTEERKNYYKKWLSKYKNIAVREDSAVEILQDLDIKASQVLDPTLLLDSQYWSQYCTPIAEKKYILIYQLHNDKKLGEYAKKVAKAKKLPLIRISTSLHQISREGKFKWAPELGQFLSYIKNAECMITDSFHGTAFAINFNTPFIEVLPNNKTGTRNMSILRLTKFTDRILQNPNDISLAQKPMNFTYANKVMKEKREESIKILKSMLEEELVG